MSKETEGTEMSALVVHKVGNKLQEEGIQFSKNPVHIAEPAIQTILTTYFLSAFKNQECYTFFHDNDLNLNEVYTYVQAIFNTPENIYEQSVKLAKYLYDVSDHHKIKSGEFYVAYFNDCLLDGELVNCVGLFKSESKETYLKVYPSGENFDIQSEEGINITKLDKGCLIYQTNPDKGYTLKIVDTGNKTGEEARYWKDGFLRIKLRQDSFHYTQNYMSMCKQFVKDQLPKEFEIENTDRIDLLNRSMDFFKNKEVFDVNEYTNEVIQQKELIDSFKTYKEEFTTKNDLPIVDEFHISETAIKKQSAVFKSILKLDRNFHVYIHGNKDLIERGFDQNRGMSYYTLFFEKESC